MRNKNTQTRLKRLSPEQFMTAYGYDNIVARQWLHDFVRANNGWLWYGDKSTYTNGVLDLIGGEHTQPNLIDGNMEAVGTAAWSSYGGATLSKQGSAYAGTQCLRATYNGSGYPGAAQSILINGCRYVCTTGAFRGDGVHALATPIIQFGNAANGLTGTNSNTWQSMIGAEGTCGADGILYLYSSLIGTGYTEFDNLAIQNRSIIYQPPKVGTGVLTQSTATAMPYGGDSGTAASPGRRIINFDGTADYLTCNELATLANYGNNYTTFISGKLTSLADGVFQGCGNSAASNPLNELKIVSNKWHALRRDAAAAAVSASSVADADTNMHVIEDVLTTGVARVTSLDGVVIINQPITTLGAATFDRFSIGCLVRAAASEFSNFRYSSLVVFPSVISAANRSTIRRILGAMNSITVTP